MANGISKQAVDPKLALSVLQGMGRGPQQSQPATDWMPFIAWASKYLADATWPGLTAREQQGLMQQNLANAQAGLSIYDLYGSQQVPRQETPAATYQPAGTNAAALQRPNPQGTNRATTTAYNPANAAGSAKKPDTPFGELSKLYGDLNKIATSDTPLTVPEALGGIKRQDVLNGLTGGF